jgi:group II intron reverse transcriptase/maturase
VIVHSTENTKMTKARTFRRKLYCAAKLDANRKFGILYDKVVRKDVLEEAWQRVAANKGACGVDEQSIEWIRDEYGVERYPEEIRQELEEQRYGPALIRRTYIPKPDGKQRPLGIPVVKDRVIQMAVKLVIEPLFEADFLECSYGFRPKRSNQQAAEMVHKHVNYNKWVVDIDLKGYFDTIPHDRLMDCVRRRVTDRRVLHLIRSWLKAGVLEDGAVTVPKQGTPQGGVLSPLLSNIYLHEFDRRWNERNGKLVRFADDMVILCRHQWQAQRAMNEASRILTELGLTLNTEKSKLVHVKDSFVFMGFTYREGFSTRLKRLVRVKLPSKKNVKEMRRKIKQRLKKLPLGVSLTEAVKAINPMLRGWANYFRIGNAYEAALGLAQYACDQLRLFWRKRKQSKRTRGSRRWPDSFFYERGVHYVPNML